MPPGGFGETAVADPLAIAADVVDAAGGVKRREQRAAGVLDVQRGAQARVRMVVAGTRAVEKSQAICRSAFGAPAFSRRPKMSA